MNQNRNSISRRDVLRSSLYAGTAVLLPTWAKALGANEDIRIGVIGFNGRGSGHISTLAGGGSKGKPGLAGARIVALCDVDSDVMDKHVNALKKMNIEVRQYVDYRKLLE